MHIVVVNTQETVKKNTIKCILISKIPHCIFCGLHTNNGKLKTIPIYTGMILLIFLPSR